MARAVAVVNNLLHNVQGKLPVSCTLNLCSNFLIILIRVNVGGSTCGSAALSGRGCCNCSAGLFSRESPSGRRVSLAITQSSMVSWACIQGGTSNRYSPISSSRRLYHSCPNFCVKHCVRLVCLSPSSYLGFKSDSAIDSALICSFYKGRFFSSVGANSTWTGYRWVLSPSRPLWVKERSGLEYRLTPMETILRAV